MVSFTSILAAVPLLAITLAQQQKIAFTSTPAVAVTGQSYNISWGGGDNTAVTLTLRRGDPNNLNTVSTIADSVLANYYVWTVPTVLAPASDYALQITQGQSDINYSGLFTIRAGSGTSNSTTTASGNSTITSMGTASGTGTAMMRNSTFSTATLTSTDTNSFGATSRTATRTSATAAATTTAPSNDAITRTGSSAALILGIVAAVMLH